MALVVEVDLKMPLEVPEVVEQDAPPLVPVGVEVIGIEIIEETGEIEIEMIERAMMAQCLLEGVVIGEGK